MKLIVNLKQIKQYIEGNLNMLEDNVLGKPLWYKEQIAYRASKCTDCFANGKCRQCGCDLPGKHYVTKSCNPERFPDLMDEVEWNMYKSVHGLEFKWNDEDTGNI